MSGDVAPVERCEMFCDNVLGPDDFPSEGGPNRASCVACDRLYGFLCMEYLPAVAEHGFYAPTGSDVDAEFRAMVEQPGELARIHAVLVASLGESAAAGLMALSRIRLD